MKETILAYTAGIIDGEGHISCHFNKNRNHWEKTIQVHMKYKKVPQWMNYHWKGSLYQRKDKSWQWKIGALDGEIMLRQLMSYLVEKWNQGHIWLEIVELGKLSKRGRKDSFKMKKAKEKLHKELKEMHN